jgi:hypothetical protein
MTREKLVVSLISKVGLLHQLSFTHCFFLIRPLPIVLRKGKVKIHNHPLRFDLVANKLPGVLILQYNYLGFLNW